MGQEVTITSDNFEAEVLQSDTPVLVDFWADWCGPCKTIAPAVEALSEDYAGKVKVGKVNVDDAGDLAMKFNVVSIPTLLLFKDGSVVDQQVGAVPKAKIEGMFKALV
jgi:thioredoxin 1